MAKSEWAVKAHCRGGKKGKPVKGGHCAGKPGKVTGLSRETGKKMVQGHTRRRHYGPKNKK